MKEQCSREVEQLCVFVLYMLECNAADVQIDAGTNLMVNREGNGNNTKYGM